MMTVKTLGLGYETYRASLVTLLLTLTPKVGLVDSHMLTWMAPNLCILEIVFMIAIHLWAMMKGLTSCAPV